MSLDDDLAVWAASVRLDDAEADAIFRRIIATPAPSAPSALAASRPKLVPVSAGLTPSWWRDYSKGFATQMVTSTRPVRLAA